ncbi:hypothetical protein BMR06_16375, partial [Methylococcaceae bacterium HT5]
MELIIKVLKGKRQGKSIFLQPESGYKKDTSLPYLLETDAISLHLNSQESYSAVELLMDDSE